MPITINFDQLLGTMIDAARTSLQASVKGKWPKVRDLTTSTLKTLAQNMVDIGDMKNAGTVTEEQARLMMDIQKNAFKTLLLTEKGIGLLVAEDALNAVLKAVRDLVNGSVGFLLL